VSQFEEYYKSRRQVVGEGVLVGYGCESTDIDSTPLMTVIVESVGMLVRMMEMSASTGSVGEYPGDDKLRAGEYVGEVGVWPRW